MRDNDGRKLGHQTLEAVRIRAVEQIQGGVHGQFLVSEGGNIVDLWDLNEEHAIQRICATTRNIVTLEQWQHHISQLLYEPPCREQTHNSDV